MKSREINSLFKNLSKTIKNPKSDLKYKNKFTLLVSVVLSAQCTDVNVNNVTKNIYPNYNKPEHFIKLGRKKIEKLIKSIGLFRNKAKSVYLLSKQLIEKHNGKVPNNFDDLYALPGVGKKYLNKKTFPYSKKINFNSIRKGEIVGNHKVSFSSGKETITLDHEAFDRALYSEGAFTAAKWLMSKKPGLYSMRNVLNFK